MFPFVYWQVGSRVMALWESDGEGRGIFYPGRIDEHNSDGTYRGILTIFLFCFSCAIFLVDCPPSYFIFFAWFVLKFLRLTSKKYSQLCCWSSFCMTVTFDDGDVADRLLQIHIRNALSGDLWLEIKLLLLNSFIMCLLVLEATSFYVVGFDSF